MINEKSCFETRAMVVIFKLTWLLCSPNIWGKIWTKRFQPQRNPEVKRYPPPQLGRAQAQLEKVGFGISGLRKEMDPGIHGFWKRQLVMNLYFFLPEICLEVWSYRLIWYGYFTVDSCYCSHCFVDCSLPCVNHWFWNIHPWHGGVDKIRHHGVDDETKRKLAPS